MTDQRELDRILGTFFVEGTDELADRVIDAALDQIETTPQRRPLGLPRRFLTMNRYAQLAAGVAVVAVIAAGAILVGGRTSPGPGVGASPSPTGSAVASGSARPTSLADAYQARPGYILLEHFGNSFDGTATDPSDERHLWLVKADGTGMHELAPGKPTSEPPVAGKGAADWSPDGTHIVFSTSQNGGLIYETDVNGATPRLVSTGCPPTSCLEAFPAYSPDGKRIAFIRLTGIDGKTPVSGIVGIRDLATGQSSFLESTRAGSPEAELGAPDWSPDGLRLIYYKLPKDAQGKPTGGSAMYIVNTDGTALHKLDVGNLIAGDPAWSPDGTLIAFSTYPIHEWAETGTGDVPETYIVRPDGTGLRALTANTGGAPSWTADGKIFYYSQRAMWLMDADGSNQTPIGPGQLNLVSSTTGYSYYGYWQPTP
jgi:dipeptidyl aminopeptidase/acylaminoacyl peptidase